MHKIKKILMVSSTLALISVSGFADDSAERVERRSEYTKNSVIVAVSPCVPAEFYVDGFGNRRVRSQFTVMACQEKKEFDASVVTSGKWYNWSSKVTPIEGTESYSYEVTNQLKGADEMFNEAHPLQFSAVRLSCEQMRNGYVAAAEASRGTAKCRF